MLAQQLREKHARGSTLRAAAPQHHTAQAVDSRYSAYKTRTCPRLSAGGAGHRVGGADCGAGGDGGGGSCRCDARGFAPALLLAPAGLRTCGVLARSLTHGRLLTLAEACSCCALCCSSGNACGMGETSQAAIAWRWWAAGLCCSSKPPAPGPPPPAAAASMGKGTIAVRCSCGFLRSLCGRVPAAGPLAPSACLCSHGQWAFPPEVLRALPLFS